MALPFSGHGVTLGGLSLVDWGQPVTYDEGYTFEISADGTTWGNPQVVVSSLISMLSNGEIVEQQHTGNREPVLYVRISATDHHALVAGDTALGAVVGGPCELVWQPPDPDAPPSVIEVVHSRMDHQWDDMDALKFQRVWVITMAALPWVRSADLVVTPAIAAATATVVNAGTSTTGWSSTNGVLSVVSGAVVSTYDGNTLVGGNTLYGGNLKLTAAVDTSVENYISVDWKSSVPAFHAFSVNGGGNLAEARREPSPTTGYTRSWYRVTRGGLSSLQFGTIHTGTSGSPTLSIDLVQKSATLPVSGTGRQLSRVVVPGGNVPAQGSIIVEHPTTGLGRTLAYSHPSGGGYSPPLRPWIGASDTVNSDPAARFSGKFNSLTGISNFLVPVSAVPTGDVHLWAALGTSTGTGTVRIFWSATSYMNGVVVGDSQVGSTDITFPVEGQWGVHPLARLTLPTAAIGPSGFVRIGLQRDPAAAQVLQFDEGWLFAMDRGRLTVVDCGSGPASSGTVANRLRVSAPSPTEPFGRIQVATAADFSDAWTPAESQVLCDQTGHEFDAAGSNIWTGTSDVDNAAVSLEHYPRFRAEVG